MATVAPAVAFRAALQQIGFNVATQEAINENGFETMEDLVSISEEDLDRLPKHLESWRDPDLDPEYKVRVPFVSLKCCKAMRYCNVRENCWFRARHIAQLSAGSTRFGSARSKPLKRFC